MLFSVAAVIRLGCTTGAGEFARRECHCTEKAAGVCRLGTTAIFIGYAVIGCGDEELCRTFNAEYGKETKRDIETVSVYRIDEVAERVLVKQFARDVVHRAGTVASTRAIARLNSANTEHNRLNGLYNTDRHVA